MTYSFLCSGSLDDYQAAGSGGLLVFDSAQQIRETLRLRKYQTLVDCLAIPQINTPGDQVDWYAPREGSPVTWHNAETILRIQALHKLDTLLANVRALSLTCRQSDKLTLQRFGLLLENVLQFPGEEHLFLINDDPVIAFWGFTRRHEAVSGDILADLRRTLPASPDTHLIIPEEVAATEATMTPDTSTDVSVVIPSEKKCDFPEASLPQGADEYPAGNASGQGTQSPRPDRPDTPLLPEPTTAPRRHLPRWLLPVITSLLAALLIPWLWLPSSASHENTSPKPDVIPPAVVIEKHRPLPLPVPDIHLPLHQAQVSAPPPLRKAEATAETVIITAIPKDALVMDAGQMRAGTTRFLNGQWRAIMNIQDPATGKSPSLRYKIQNNKGTARVVHGNNVICHAEIFSGLHQTGELMIKSRGNAHCTDGSRYPMPEITCKAGVNNVAECTARFDGHTELPLTFKKAGS